MSKTSGNKVAVLASGQGSNLQALIDAERTGILNAHISLVISDKKNAFALERAKAQGIDTLFVNPKKFSTREHYDAELYKIMQAHRVDWVVLAGFMRILSHHFVRPLLGRVMNIHPSLLPKYPGTASIQRAFASQESETGVTVHFVDEGVDTGQIILQERVKIEPHETLEGLTDKIHTLEHTLLPRALNQVIKGEVVFQK